jgi:pimeloyl-ACP methyl ester carboxylesterase
MHPNVAPTVPSSSIAAADSWCEVRAHQRVIRYRRIGDGPAPMLLLLDGSSLAAHWPELTQALAAGFRVVIPQLAGGVDDTPAVVRCLLDGLGASGVAVIATGLYSEVAMALATGDEEQVGSLVLVSDEEIQSESPVPLLLLSRRLTLEAAFTRIHRFLRGGLPPGR